MFSMLALVTILHATPAPSDGCGTVISSHNGRAVVAYSDHTETRQDSRLDVGDTYCPASAPVHTDCSHGR